MNNNIFSINRFEKVIKNDISRYVPKYYGALLVFLSIMPFIAFINLVILDTTLGANTRLVLLFLITVVAAFVSPFIIYKTANHKKKGVDFIMLPASALEKFLSMVLITAILIPIGIMAAQIIIDTLISLILPSVFKGTLFSINLFNLENIGKFGEIMLFQCFALAGNMVFHQYKLSKSIACIFVLLMIVGSIMSSTLFYIVKNSDSFTEAIKNEHRISENEIDSVTLNNGNAKIFINERQVEVMKEGSSSKKIVVYDVDNILYLYSRHLQIAWNLFMYIIVPLLLYYLTYIRIKKEQL